jgi:serine/threonine protein kinase
MLEMKSRRLHAAAAATAQNKISLVAPEEPSGEEPPAKPTDEKIEIDGYELEDLLGAGGMGEVYRASRQGLDGKLAVKILKSNLLPDEGCRRRFEQEARAAALLTSPHLVSVLGYGIAEAGAPYLVMEYIDGESLAAFLSRERHVESGLFTNIFAQVCEALIHSHGKEIIHRDLKPSNIMLSPQENGSFLIKVVDFGIARLLPRAETNEQKLTQTGELLGSPVYMSPEQCTGQPMDARSDIYSLGCVMYEALTGRPPFLGDNVVQTILMHLHDEPARFDEILCQNTVPAEIEEIVRKCLEKRPPDRYQSAEELKEALESVDLHTSAARKRLIRKNQQRNKLRRLLRLHEKSAVVFLAAALSLVSFTLVASSRHNAEVCYQKTIDAAELADADWQAQEEGKKRAAKLWKKAIYLADTLFKPAKTRAGLHMRLARSLAPDGNIHVLPQETEMEKEFARAIRIYKGTADSTSCLIVALENLSNKLMRHYFMENDGTILYTTLIAPTPSQITAQAQEALQARCEKARQKQARDGDLQGAIALYESARNEDSSEAYGCWTPGLENAYGQTCRDYALKIQDRNESLPYFEKAVESEDNPEWTFACLKDLDRQMQRQRLEPRSFADRMQLASEAAARKDYRAAVLEATIALSIRDDRQVREKLAAWRWQFSRGKASPGESRASHWLEKLVEVKERVFGTKSQKLNGPLKDLACCNFVGGNYQGAYAAYRKLTGLAGNKATADERSRLATLALSAGDVCGALAFMKESVLAYEKYPDRNDLTMGRMHEKLSRIYMLFGNYAQARQELSCAQDYLAKVPAGTYGVCSSGSTWPGPDVSLDL